VSFSSAVYREIETEVLKQMLKPGEQIKGWTIRDITTSELSCGATCHAPAIRPDSAVGTAYFPDPKSYETETVPLTSITAIRE